MIPGLHFISHRELLRDIRAWSAELPDDLIAVAGVPRSGLLPALYLALHRNLHLVTLEELRHGQEPWRTRLRRGVPSREPGRILILDDSIHTGGTLRGIRRQLPPDPRLLFGAVYYVTPLPELADVVFRQVPRPRCFEWMVFHSDQMRTACLDLDGVLCDDPPFTEEDDPAGVARWREHLHTVRPKFLPGYPVQAIVTSRLEKYRPETVDWLQHHGVRYGELVMSPHLTAAARRQAADHATHKAAYYRQSSATLFVESSLTQARITARLTGKPVLCTDTMELFQN